MVSSEFDGDEADSLGFCRVDTTSGIRDRRLGFLQAMTAMPAHGLLDFETVLGPEPALLHQDIGEDGIFPIHPFGVRPRKLISIDHLLHNGEHPEKRALVIRAGSVVEGTGHELKLVWVQCLSGP